MVIGILQPGYLPWLGFFEQLHRSDIFVIYDDVQYDKHGWRNRNRIKTANGIQWLTVPVLLKYNKHPQICEVRIDNMAKWRKKHLETIRQSYSRAPYFEHYFNIFESSFACNWEYLIDLDVHLMTELVRALGLPEKPMVRSSTLGIEGGRIDRLIKICTYFGADTFYEGASGVNYIDPAVFLENGIRVKFQEYRHPTYPQLYGDFMPYLSLVDLLFNCGDKSLDILIGNTSPEVVN
ncbi:WbqC family protein [Trichlorobacter lovleyi]|uniref:WbqC family protein n=1 Tax=Trichlorobacter lovleyi TaxID=313985 RepID=UPI00223F1DDE|nr:WbqC family protein [Trichlorobacter lovleyi]QOX80356.1 WbqC family protein [Trichlorobacter lovleyi]